MKGLIIMALLWNPIYMEENIENEPVTETNEEESGSSEESGTEPSAAETIIEYLEQQRIAEEQRKAEEAEAEKIRAEEEAKAEEEQALKEEEEAQLLMINRLNTNGYTSQTNVVYGLANKYPFYIVGQRQISSTYSRYDYYVWVFDRWAKFNIEGNIVNFENTSCKLFYVPYDGNMQSSEVEDTYINIDGGLLNVYSNISKLDIPALYNIDKNSQDAVTEIISISVMVSSIIVGYLGMLAMLHGSRH